MKSFQEIAKSFEQMIQIKNSGLEEGEKIKLSVEDVTLGYMRVYDPGADNTSGLLVPVWDFFGAEECTRVYNGEATEYVNAQKNTSYLTINAADGSVIDRSLGY